MECVKEGIVTIDGIKQKTKAGTGCGGCMPLVTNIFKVSVGQVYFYHAIDLTATRRR